MCPQNNLSPPNELDDADDSAPEPVAHTVEIGLNQQERDLNLFDAVTHELAKDASEQPYPMTPEEAIDVAWLMERAYQRMGKRRPDAVDETPGSPKPPSETD